MRKPYTPPEVWSWDRPDDSPVIKGNRPIAGATHTRDLPLGVHPLQLYSLGTPNGLKVTVLLEELLALGFVGAEYDAWMVAIMDGEQFGSGFVAINPNSKIPALVDRSGPEPIRVFESGAILLYLAEKFGAFMPMEGAARAEALSWLFWQVGSAPSLGGGFGHFFAMAPEKLEYPINRYAMEAKRIFDVADRRLAESRYLAGDAYTIADMANFTWLRHFYSTDAYRGGSKFLDITSYQHLGRWVEEIAARVPVQRGLKVNRPGEAECRERHSAADIDAVMGG